MQHRYHPSLRDSKLFRSELLNIRFFEVEEEEKRNSDPKKRKKGSGSLRSWRAELSCAPRRNNLTPMIKGAELHPAVLRGAAPTVPAGFGRLAAALRPPPIQSDLPPGADWRALPTGFHVKPRRFGLAERCAAPHANRMLLLLLVVT